MLYDLHVKNLAVIDEIEVTFSEGLNVLTGETGAGKSVIIDSVSIALGGRVPKGIIREGEKEALVELEFTLDDPDIIKELEDLGVVVDPEENMLVISRRISGKRTINRVNGESVTAARLREISSLMIDIHGQNQHQSLLNKGRHREILDLFAKEEADSLKKNIRENYSEYMALKKKLQEGDIPEEERNREISFLSFELNEIRNANIRHGEEEELADRFRKLNNSKRIEESLGEAYALAGGDRSASGLLSEALTKLREAAAYDEKLSSIAEEISQSESIIEDALREMTSYLEDMGNSDEELQEVTDRLDLIRDLKAKYGRTAADVNAYGNKIEEKLEKYRQHDEIKKKTEEKLAEIGSALKSDAAKLTEVRKKYAGRLDREITQALRDLNFLQVRFETEVRKTGSITSTGEDEVEFMVSLNPGTAMKPLENAASGGELSRIMLALKSVFADQDRIPTLIFDEIDTGISGRTAQKVAEKMCQISEKHQVICISHLAQIAAMADAHYLIEKKNEGDTTRTFIRELKPDEITRELARIIGGVSITDAVKASAGEMKKMADEVKEKIRNRR